MVKTLGSPVTRPSSFESLKIDLESSAIRGDLRPSLSLAEQVEVVAAHGETYYSEDFKCASRELREQLYTSAYWTVNIWAHATFLEVHVAKLGVFLAEHGISTQQARKRDTYADRQAEPIEVVEMSEFATKNIYQDEHFGRIGIVEYRLTGGHRIYFEIEEDYTE